jgi:hypothetical protein
MYNYTGKTQVSTPKGEQYNTLDKSSHSYKGYTTKDDPTSKYSSKSYTSNYQNPKSRINFSTPKGEQYNSLDELSYPHKRSTTRDDLQKKFINNYEIKCVYRINMNNYYKNINIYNYKKKIII